MVTVSDSGPCPFINHQIFTVVPGLQYEEQLKPILGDNIMHMPVKPLVSELTPPSLFLFKLIHADVMPRKSGRDRVTFQDSILPSLFIKQISFNMSLLIIRNMSYSSSHDSMHLSYLALLTHVFKYFGVLSDKDLCVQ